MHWEHKTCSFSTLIELDVTFYCERGDGKQEVALKNKDVTVFNDQHHDEKLQSVMSSVSAVNKSVDFFTNTCRTLKNSNKWKKILLLSTFLFSGVCFLQHIWGARVATSCVKVLLTPDRKLHEVNSCFIDQHVSIHRT